jgi:hypothetical protein
MDLIHPDETSLAERPRERALVLPAIDPRAEAAASQGEPVRDGVPSQLIAYEKLDEPLTLTSFRVLALRVRE